MTFVLTITVPENSDTGALQVYLSNSFEPMPAE